MFVLHGDISAGKRCVVGESVAGGANASKSHSLMVLCRHIEVLVKDQHLVASVSGQSCTDGCYNDRRIASEWTHDVVKGLAHINKCDIR